MHDSYVFCAYRYAKHEFPFVLDETISKETKLQEVSYNI